jgi:hypothetical protein
VEDEKLTAEASIAQATGALKTMADGGFRWMFDVPQSELSAHVRIHLYQNKRLRLTIEVLEDDGTTEDRDRYFED